MRPEDILQLLRTRPYEPFRIYLSDGSDLDREPIALDDRDAVDDFDPQVVRK